MKVAHGNRTGDIGGANLILSNSKGGFLNLGLPNSKFQGFFVSDGEVFKVLEEIRGGGEVLEVSSNIFSVRMRRKNFTESFVLPKNFNSLVYETAGEQELEFVFDVRKAYDLTDAGRIYKFHQEKNAVILEFTKYGEPIFVVVGNVKGVVPVGSWVEQDYSADGRRNSPPFRWWVYSAFKAKSGLVVITAYRDREKAVEENALVLRELKRIMVNEKNAVKHIAVGADDKSIAVNYSANALSGLVFSSGVEGIIAGFPWFFQLWTRDEAVSLRALGLVGEEQLEKKILLQRITMIDSSGRLPNRIPGSGIASADSVGWLFLRFNDVLKLLDDNEKKLVSAGLKNALELLIKNFHRDGFFVNGPLETWMDTDFGGDSRGGARIEIQALMAGMFNLAYSLTREEIYSRLAESLVKNVRSKFLAGGFIKDGSADFTVRPNIFIAYYACPGLFPRGVWEKCFDYALSRLWLEWGGISTIDKTSPLFTSDYTGENNKSYHRGDSWYWLNNLAAVCMCRLNKNRFKHYINAILDASVRDILWQGAVGASSEVSSASRQTASGCLSQAWSSAMFIELCSELGLIGKVENKKLRKKKHKAVRAVRRMKKHRASIRKRRSRLFRTISVRKKM
jgi:hypothetical protein